jgi:hypothetical protein
MALSGRVIFSSYDGSNTNGRMKSLPSALTTFTALNPAQTQGGITVNTMVELLPTGLNQKKMVYYTPSTTSDLQTNGN